MSKMIKTIIQQYQIRNKVSTLYHSQANGQVESTNKVLEAILTKTYGKKILLPIKFQIKTFRMAAQLGMDLSEAQKQRLLQLNELDEIRQDAIQHNILVQE